MVIALMCSGTTRLTMVLLKIPTDTCKVQQKYYIFTMFFEVFALEKCKYLKKQCKNVKFVLNLASICRNFQ